MGGVEELAPSSYLSPSAVQFLSQERGTRSLLGEEDESCRDRGRGFRRDPSIRRRRGRRRSESTDTTLGAGRDDAPGSSTETCRGESLCH